MPNNKPDKLDQLLQKMIADAKQREQSWGDTHNANYWFDKGRKEALMELRVHLKEHPDER